MVRGVMDLKGRPAAGIKTGTGLLADNQQQAVPRPSPVERRLIGADVWLYPASEEKSDQLATLSDSARNDLLVLFNRLNFADKSDNRL